MAACQSRQHLWAVSFTPDPANIPPALAAALADHYRLLRELGIGGMATVYLAEDLKHHRQVAVKVLRPELSASLGTERFLREIEIAAGLHHPHILPLYDSGAATPPGGSPFLYYVMPYVDGESLRARLARERQLPLDDALRIVREVADALSYAHGKGVVHRDIKPENILLESGHAMVADFGIARALAEGKRPEHPEGAKDRANLTEPGMALGTPAYMSPEQAMGDRNIDARSDLYSLGCVLYEMLAGQPPFQGATFEVLLRQHMTAPSLPVTQYRPTTPQYVADAIARALEKNPADRYSSTREFAAALGEGHTSGPRPAPTVTTPAGTLAPAPALRPVPRSLIYTGMALGAVAIAWRLAKSGPVRTITQAPAPPPATRLVQLTFHEGIEEWPAWSPDGKQLVFSQEVGGFKKLFVKDLASGTERQLTSVPKDDIQPSWSPDGKQVAFVRASTPTGKLEPGDVLGWYNEGGDVWSIDVATGKERSLIERAFNPAWSPDGVHLAFDAGWAGARRIWVADSNGRNPQQVTSDSVESVVHASARWSPDGNRLVFRRILKTRSDIRVVDLGSKAVAVITDDNVPDLDPAWAPSGRFIYFSSSRGGGLNIWRVPVGEVGPSGPAQQLTTGAGPDLELAASPDGRQLAFAVLGINSDVWRLPVDPVTGRPTGDPSVLIGTTRVESRAAWSRDGKSIAFNSDRQGDMNLWVRTLADGMEKQVTTGPGGDYQPDWSPDGTTLVFFSSRSGNNEIWSVDIASGTLKQLTSGPGTKTNPFYSPDGSQVAFHSDRDGRIEAWVMNADGSGERQLTNGGSGGHFMRWATGGKALFLTARTPSGVRIVRLDVATGAMDSLPPIASGAHISLSPDQKRILDVRNHKTVWVHPLDGSEPYQVFEFADPDIRIDYPVWSPDGKWILFDRAAPSGGDIWLLEGLQ
jgi:serine/threonine-protein kinase